MLNEDNKKQNINNVHVLPLRKNKGAKKRVSILDTEEKIETTKITETTKESQFEELAKKLESRIGKIETELSESLRILDADIHKVLKSKGMDRDEKNIRSELNDLSSKLEARIQQTLNNVSKTSDKSDREGLEMIKKLTSQLVKVLSFDFYKNVIDRLQSTEQEEEIDPYGMDYQMVQRIKPLFDFLYTKYWRVKTTGIENIPAEGKALIVGNHSGTVPYDGAMIKAAIVNEHAKRNDARYLVEDFVFHMPMLGTLMYRIGGVRACQENAERLLNAGHMVIVFPEGVKGIGKLYSERYKLQRFGRGGFIKLCMKTQSPLIPVGVVGAEEIHPILFKSNVLAKTIGLPYIPITPTFPLLGLLGLIPFPSQWSIHFGKPITFSQYGPEALDDDMLIHKLSEKVRGQIQQIIFDLLKKRSSVWTG